VSWWRRRLRATIGVVATLATLATTAALTLTHDGGAASAPLPLAALSTLGAIRSIGAVGPLGPEGVPMPAVPASGRVRLIADGESIDGITCQSSEQVLFHIHAHLTIFVRGVARQVPAGIGIAPPYQVASTPKGAFVAGATCFVWLHTHAADGIIHTESPVQRTYTLGEFFDIWGQQLNRNQVGSAQGRVTALFNGQVFTGSPRQIPLLAHAQIQLEVGRPLVVPEKIVFPEGL
jgi:hypothetical protein